MYKAEARKNDIVFRRMGDDQEQFSIDVRGFADFCSRIEKQIPPYAAMDGTDSQDKPLYNIYVMPAAFRAMKLSLLEEAKMAMGHSALQHAIEDRQLIEASCFPYDDLAKRARDFVKIGTFCHSYPLAPSSNLDKEEFRKRLLTLAMTKGEKDGDLVRVFDMKALGFGRGERKEFCVRKTDMLIRSDIIERIEDRGTYRVLHPRPDCYPVNLRGARHRALREVVTPESLKRLENVFMPSQYPAPKSTL